MKRQKMSSRKDKKIFRRTATTTKAINVVPVTYRGGIRL